MAEARPTTLSLDRYAADAKAWVVAAQSFADDRRHAEVTPVHLLLRGLERHPGIAEVFRRAGADVSDLTQTLERGLAGLPKGDGPSYLSSRLLDLLSRADRDADRERASAVGVEHVLGALSQEIRGPAGEALSAFGIAPGSLRPHFPVLRGLRSPPSFGGEAEPANLELHDLVSRSRDDAEGPIIGRDAELRRLVTILERREKRHPLLVGEPGVGKRAIVRALAGRIAAGDVPARLASARLFEVEGAALVSAARTRADVETRVKKLLDQSQSASGEPILFVRGLEQLFGAGPAAGSAGEALRAALLGGKVQLLGTTTTEGLRKITERDAGFFRELTLLEVEEPSPADATEMLRGIATRFESHHGVRIGESAVVAAVTLAKRYLPDRRLPDCAVDLLDESSAALRVEADGLPASVDRELRRVESVRAQLASLEGVSDPATSAIRTKLVAEEAAAAPRVQELRAGVESRRGAVAAVRALRDELKKAKAFFDEARAKKETAKAGELEHVTIPGIETRLKAAEEAVVTAGGSAEKPVLGEEHVAATLAEWTGSPVAKMLEAEAEKLLHMEERLEQRVVGQTEGVRALARAVRRGRVGLRDPRRPIGSFLFLGPSGVGKTELAKALAQFLFDEESALTRLDMSEYMERHMAQRLLGAPPGYADSEQGGLLTEAVRRRPYSVLLFDEVEKAHQDVFNLLLQVLDDGRLTDGRGRLADFTNTVVILTSNIGGSRILDTEPRLFESEEGREALREVLLDELGKFFRPEFLNRLDDVIVFRPLSKDDLGRIVQLELRRVGSLLAPSGISLDADDGARARLVELGYQPALGARPLRRAILKHVQDPLAERLLRQKPAAGSRLRLTAEGEGFGFQVEEPGSRSPGEGS
jgi:ATP-dependent Clp protease ATP-binding subunit ClpB